MTTTESRQPRPRTMSLNMIISALCVVVSLLVVIPVNAQKDEVEWLYPPGLSNDVFGQAFGPPDFYGGIGPGIGDQGPPGLGPQGPPGYGQQGPPQGPQGQEPPGQGPIGGGDNCGYKPQPLISASASIIAESGENGMTGSVTFKQYQAFAPVITFINVTGMGADKQLGVHIHWYGDIAEGCNSTGPHYRQAIVGNAETKSDGNLEFEFQSPYLSLVGQNSIIGRSIVFHEKPIQYNIFPNIQPSPTEQQQDYPVQQQTEEQRVGGMVACGMITIKKLP